SQFPQNKQVTISAFYMDETEITNSEYKQFVHWVRDSIAIKRLGTGSEKYMLKPKGKDATASATFIDWKKVQSGKGIWGDKTIAEELNKNMYYQDNESFFGKKELNVEQLKYDYEW